MKAVMPAWAALLSIPALFIILCQGCVDNAWSIAIDGGPDIDNALYERLGNSSVKVMDGEGILLEIFLYHHGLYPIDSVTIDGTTYDWDKMAHDNPLDIPIVVSSDGYMICNDVKHKVANISVKTCDRPEHNSTKIAPSILYALNLSDVPGLTADKAEKVIVFYVDGLGYTRYQDAKALGLISNITSFGEPIVLSCIYPSISKVNSRTLVTGLPQAMEDGYFRSATSPEDTILDKAEAAGMDAVWVGGSPNPPVILKDSVACVDGNGNGNSDDDVVAEALRRYENGSSLIFVHINRPDKAIHTYGPYSPEGRESLRYADALIGEALSSLKPGTLVIIYSDHGCHETVSGGNHGTLIEDDMIVPVIFMPVTAQTASPA